MVKTGFQTVHGALERLSFLSFPLDTTIVDGIFASSVGKYE